MKRDYYEVLGLQQQCNQDEIKQAYRKQALKCHPDKNPSEDAKMLFQELQEAYSVLSDPNERTWYDNHKNQILGKNLSQQDIELNQTYGFDVWHYFSPHFFGYDDGHNGFYAFYREAFEKIKIEEEKAFHQSEDIEDQEYEKLPGFGTSTTNIEQVLKFYQKWENFTTYKMFGYADIYNPKEAPNRYYRRMIEKDNKKERQAEKKKYIKTIKQLVSCVKNRDPRFKEYQEQLKREEELFAVQKKKQTELVIKKYQHLIKDRIAQQELLKEKRVAEQQRFQENEEYFRNLNQFQTIVQKPTKRDDDHYCEVCDKEFRSEQQMKNHNNSNQHKKNIKELIESITKDKKEQEELLKKVGMGIKIELNIDQQQLQEQVRQQIEREEQKKEQELSKKKKQKKKKKKGLQNENREEEEEEKEQRKIQEQDQEYKEKSDESEKYDEDEEDDLNRWKSFGKSKQNLQKQESQQQQQQQSEQTIKINSDLKINDPDSPKSNEQQLEAKIEQVSETQQQQKSKFFNNESDSDNQQEDDEVNQSNKNQEKKLNKAKLKQLKKKEKQQLQQQGQGQTEQGEKFKCNACDEIFPSKSKLFKHLNDTGHQKSTQQIQLEKLEKMEKEKQLKEIKDKQQKGQKLIENKKEKSEKKSEIKSEVKQIQEEQKQSPSQQLLLQGQLVKGNDECNSAQEEEEQLDEEIKKKTTQKKKKKKNQKQDTLSEDQLKCLVCKEQFPSKTYFTKHINQTGHQQTA